MAHTTGLVYTLDKALALVGFGRFQVLVLLYAGLGTMAGAMEVMILSFIGPSVKSEWGLSSTQESLITAVVFVGLLIGAYACGIISDNCGRRMGLLIAAIMVTIPGFLSALSPNYISLVILRTLVGVGVSCGQVYAAWFLEFVPVHMRGTWMVMFWTFWTLGAILEASLAWLIMPRLGWRWLLALTSIPAFATLLFYMFTVESPRYLYTKGRKEDAYNVLEKMATVNQTTLQNGMLVSDEIAAPYQEPDSLEETPLLSTGKTNSEASNWGLSSVVMLLSSKLVKTTLLLWVVQFGNSFAYYGIILLTSNLSSGQSECQSITLHSNNPEEASVYINAFINSLAEIPGLVLSAVVVDVIGRKASMALMFMLGCLFLLPLVIHQHEVLTTASLFGARMCIIGTFTIVNIYIPEVYPTYARTTGIGISNAVGNIGGMISPVLVVKLTTNCQQMPVIVLLDCVMAVAGISALLFSVETNKRELVDTVAASDSVVIS